MSENIIEVRDLRKVFKVPSNVENKSWFKRKLNWLFREWEEKVAVEKVDLSISKGEILGYLGPNGAGKSTSIKMLTGILYPTEGDIKVHLEDSSLNPFESRRKFTRHIGVVFGQRTAMPYDIPIKYGFELFKGIYNLEEEFFKDRLNYLIKTLGVDKFMETPYRKLSLGEKMRCELIGAFLHKPEIVFLDEPTIGLDASAKIAVRDFLKKINKEEEVTIMITTHDMDDIEELCKRVVFIDEGKVVYEGGVNKFRKKYSDWKRIDVHYRKIKAQEIFNRLKDQIYVEENKQENKVVARVPISEELDFYLGEIVKSFEIVDLSITDPKLENVVARMYENQKEE